MSADAIGIELIRTLAVRSQGRDPKWVAQPDYTGDPETASAGVNVSGAIVAMVAVALRRDPAAHASRVTVETADLSATTYTVTVDGNAVAYDASAQTPADKAALVTGIADAINANGTVGAIVTATTSDEDGDGVIDTIVLTNDTGGVTDHTTAVSVAGGSGALSFDEDADAASLRLWLLADTDNDTGIDIPWALGNEGSFGPLDYRGFLERFITSGTKRIYVEAHTITGPSGTGDGVLQIKIGPGGLES